MGGYKNISWGQMSGDSMSRSTSGNAWGSIWSVHCEGGMQVGTGGLVDVHATVTGLMDVCVQLQCVPGLVGMWVHVWWC